MNGPAATIRRRPVVVMTKTQFHRACALGGVPLSDSDVDDVFRKYGGVNGGAIARDGGVALTLELEKFAEAIVSMPQRALGAKPARALDTSLGATRLSSAGKITRR